MLNLQCGHQCIGFCGEKCPPVCRESKCHKYDSDTFEIILGSEQNQDVKFVLLEDCGHSIEGSDLLKWLQTSTDTAI
jgi:hypothetical protein